MSAEFTPGPWRRSVKAQAVVADSPAPGIKGSDEVGFYGGHLICESVNAANALLIESAPELLAYLERLVGFASHYAHQSAMDTGGNLLIENARAVIAKAIGAPHDH